MNELKKSRIKTVFKYSWPFYLISAVLTVFGLYFVFSIIHKTPAYKTLTLFASGEVTEPKKLNRICRCATNGARRLDWKE